MEAAITKEDHVITAYRDHGTFLGRGGTVFEIFSELFGKKTGKFLFLFTILLIYEKIRMFKWKRR